MKIICEKNASVAKEHLPSQYYYSRDFIFRQRWFASSFLVSWEIALGEKKIQNIFPCLIFPIDIPKPIHSTVVIGVEKLPFLTKIQNCNTNVKTWRTFILFFRGQPIIDFSDQAYYISRSQFFAKQNYLFLNIQGKTNLCTNLPI